MSIFLAVIFALLGLLALVVAGLMWRRKNGYDRLLALDLLGLLLVAFLTVLAIDRQDPFYLDLALGLAGLGFVGTVAWARALEAP